MSIPVSWFDEAIVSVELCTSCEDLRRTTNKLFATITPVEQQISQQIALLAPLLTAPINPAACVTWITNYIAFLSGPSAQLTSQMTELTSQISRLTAAITNTTNKLGCP